MPTPYCTDQSPAYMPPLPRRRHVRGLTIQLIGLDSNGHDTNGLYWGRGGDKCPVRITFADGTKISGWVPATVRDAKPFLHAHYPMAKIRYVPCEMPEHGVNFDHKTEQHIVMSSERAVAAEIEVARQLSRGDRWRLLRMRKRELGIERANARAPGARPHSQILAERLGKLIRRRKRRSYV